MNTKPSQRRPLATITASALIASVVAANIATSHFGLVPAGFGLLVTAGTYLAFGPDVNLPTVLHWTNSLFRTELMEVS